MSCNCSSIFYSCRYTDWLRAGRRNGRSSSSGRVKNFFFSTSSRTVLRPTQRPIQWEPGARPLLSSLAVDWWRFSTTDVSFPLGSRTAPDSATAYHSNSSKGLNCSSSLTNSLSHSPTNSSLHSTPNLSCI
jgi:hypothetical protein